MSSGSCCCGNIEYEYSNQPAMKAVCHCLTCRKISGSSNTVNYAVPAADLTIKSGQPKQFATKHESGMTLTVYFCGDCSSILYKEADSDMFKGLALIQAGTLDDASVMGSGNVDAELYVKDRVPWLSQIRGAGQMQTFTESKFAQATL